MIVLVVGIMYSTAAYKSSGSDNRFVNPNSMHAAAAEIRQQRWMNIERSPQPAIGNLPKTEIPGHANQIDTRRVKTAGKGLRIRFGIGISFSCYHLASEPGGPCPFNTRCVWAAGDNQFNAGRQLTALNRTGKVYHCRTGTGYQYCQSGNGDRHVKPPVFFPSRTFNR